MKRPGEFLEVTVHVCVVKICCFCLFVLNRAFTATECVESQWAIAGNSVIELSVQELISCSKSKGCAGGNTLEALKWLEKYVSTVISGFCGKALFTNTTCIFYG